jgi:hypothetical protein
MGMMPPTDRPGPARDRALAQKPRQRPRVPISLGEVVGALMKSEDIQRMRRFQHVRAALRSCLPERYLTRLTPIQLKAGVLTVEVADGLLLTEVRQHYASRIEQALAQAGTGISRVIYRVVRAKGSTR